MSRTKGAIGTHFTVRSVTPCEVGQNVHAALIYAARKYGDLVGEQNSAATDGHGGWQVSLTLHHDLSGPADVIVWCRTGETYETQYQTRTFDVTTRGHGYWLATMDPAANQPVVHCSCYVAPHVVPFGDAGPFWPSDYPQHRNFVGMAANPATGTSYWLAQSDGGVFGYGDAKFYGSAAGLRLREPIVGIAATPTGKGYWLVGANGGVFGYGDAHFYGSAVARHERVVSIAATPSGHGYWIATASGDVLARGDAQVSSAVAGSDASFVGIAATPTGQGYWIVKANGTVLPVGDALHYGDARPLQLKRPIVGIAGTADGKGYWLLAADGGVFGYGDAHFLGSCARVCQSSTFTGIAATPAP